jgi:ABC-type nitrate/sulfonate/bicarbonate transport system ATPase subunit
LAGDMRTLLADLVGDGQTTVVLVTHDAQDAAVLADRVVVLGGRPANIQQEAGFPVPRQDRDPATVAAYRHILS